MAGQIAKNSGVDIGTVAKSPQSWNIREAASIGVASLCSLLILLFVSTSTIRRSRVAVFLTEFQSREVSTLISLVGTALIAVALATYFMRQRPREWWKSIEWNTGRYTGISIVSGAVLALAWSFCISEIYANAPFRGNVVPLSLALYFVVDVVLSPMLEEFYFRGMLFLALAKRFGQVISIAIVTLLFVVVHPGHMFIIFPIAVALGAARVKTGSVASCFSLHASYNLFLLVYRLLVFR